MPATPELENLLFALWDDLHSIEVLWQVGALALCVTAGWLISRRYNLRIRGRAPLDATQAIGIGSLQRLLFPLSTLVLVLIGQAVLRYWQKANLLDVAAALLLAMAVIRMAIYAMRHTFAPSTWLRASERWISWLTWIGVVIYVAGLWPHVRGALNDVGIVFGKDRISLLLVVQAVLSAAVTLLAALWLGRVAETRLMSATSLQINVRVMFTKLVQILLLLLAILIALPAVGIDLTVLSVFGGMLGVGIGFGLQKIAANYISGFIILLDRSVSPGDLLTIGEHTGTLTKMTARYVVLRTPGGLEAIIPNENLITVSVINHTLSDRKVRIAIPVQVANATDLDQARALMTQVAAQLPRVIKDPAPGALITGFADSGINLELGVWIEDAEQGVGNLRSDLYEGVWRAFQQAGIETPYPQREIRVLGTVKTATENHK